MKHCLTIAGSDCSGGAGIQADLKAFSALGTFGMSVVTAVVAENTSTVISSFDVPNEIIKDQIDAVFTDIDVHAVKVGMLASQEVMKAVSDKLLQYSPAYTVIDPVMIAKGGHALMQPQALAVLREKIIPLAFLLTPNIPEAEAILKRKISSVEEMKLAAKDIKALGAKHVLIKGGHLDGDSTDVLISGNEFYIFNTKRILSKNTHGTGCTLSSAITANLANGLNVVKAVENGKEYVTNAITYALDIGHGHGPTNHFFDYYTQKNWV